MPAGGPGDRPVAVRRGKRVKKRTPQKRVVYRPITPRPTATQRARAQERAYASQGRAVKRAARQQKAAARVRVGADTKSDADRNRAERYKQSPEYIRILREAAKTRPQRGRIDLSRNDIVVRQLRTGYDRPRSDAELRRFLATGKRPLRGGSLNARDRRRAQITAPALTVLDQLTRPVHGIAGGVLAAQQGRNVPKAVGRGLTLKDRALFSDVLKEAGIKGPAATVGGFALDVALDPTTYLTLGTNIPGKVGARGLTIGMAGKRTTGATTARLSKATRLNVAGTKVRSGPGRLVRHVNPNWRPDSVPQKDFDKVRDALRKSRALGVVGEKRARNEAIAIHKALGGGEAHPKIIDALEARSLKGLTDQEKKVAKFLHGQYEEIYRLEKRSGQLGSTFKEFGYHPRRPASELEVGGDRQLLRRSSGTAKLQSTKTRTNRKPYKEFRGTEDDIYTQSAPLAFYLRKRESAVKLGRAHLIKTLNSTGRKFDPQAKLKEGDAVFKVDPQEPPKLVKGAELKEIYANGPGAGNYMILNEDLVNVAKQATPEPSEFQDLGRIWDRQIQGRIKTILTVPNPQYHFTNLYGDLFKAYQEDNIVNLAKHGVVSVKAMRRLAKREAAIRTLDKQLDPTSAGVKINGRKVSYDALIREAEDHGAIRSGFIGRDLPEVLEAQGKETMERLGKGRVGRRMGKAGEKVAGSRVGRTVTHPIDTIRDVSQYREDAVRFAVYLGARKRGASPSEASRKVASTLIDYGDLAPFERSVLRRVFPFWTFTARNVPHQAKTLLTKPGKFANLEKIRQEGAKAAGLEPGYEGNLEDYEQRGLPIPIPGMKIGGNPSLLFPKLPATDLNRLSTKGQGQAILAMLSPVIKAPFIELPLNYHAFFKDKIDKYLDTPGPNGEKIQEYRPAPAWLAKLMDSKGFEAGRDAVAKVPGLGVLKDVLRVKRITADGKRVWGWPARLDYVLKMTPMSGTALQIGTDVRNSRGQDAELRAIGYGTGLKFGPVDPKVRREQSLFDKRAYLDNLADAMRRQGDAYAKDGVTRTARYQKVLQQKNQLERQLKVGPYKPRPGAAATNSDPRAGAWQKATQPSEAEDPRLKLWTGGK